MNSNKATAVASFVLLAFLGNAYATEAAPVAASEPEAITGEVEIDIDAPQEASAPASGTADLNDFCFFAGTPPSDAKFTVIKPLKVGKGTYGGVKDILPKFAAYARRIGADAVVNYTGSQRFGFWPWRLVRPVVRGTAVKWSGPTRDCAALGGTTLGTILATDKAPAH